MYKSDQEIEAAYPPEGGFAEVDGWNMHHVQSGQGADVLLIHGAGGSTRDMTFRLGKQLSGLCRVTAVDRPAHGWTYGPETLAVTPLEQASLIWRFCDEVGIAAPVICGQSYGGAVALAMALLQPSRAKGFCLVSAASTDAITHASVGFGLVGRSSMMRSATLQTMTSPAFLSRAIAHLFSPEAVPEGYEDHFGPRMSFRERIFEAQSMQIAALGSTCHRMMTHYKSIKEPVRLIHGEKDRVLDHDKHSLWTSQEIPGAQLLSLPEVGHMPHQTHTDLVVRQIQDLL